MARGPYIKPDPGSGAGKPTPAVSQASPSEAMSGRRAQRSAAPSASTRPHVDSTVAGANDESDDDAVIFMEKRPRIKGSPQAETGFPRVGDVQNEILVTTTMASFNEINTKLKGLNHTLGTLHSLGIQHVASLPELVMVGDQSAGKSSLMSAISSLSLPANDGVCTRCPIHIRLSQCETLSCTVSIQEDYKYRPRGRPIRESDVTERNPFPPWEKHQRETKDFKTIRNFDSAEFEEVLRWAQIAVLNPHRLHTEFASKCTFENGYQPSAEERKEALLREEEQLETQFSPNLISLEVKGPTLPELNFYDLPGIFANARRAEDQYLTQVVENLTKAYIRHPTAIILWAVPMNADPETSMTFRHIRQLKATNRTLGVITKADLLPPGSQSHSKWQEMLENKGHEIGYGYFITSRGSTADDLEKRNAEEESFFGYSPSSEAGWPAAFQRWAEKCGVANLKKCLSLQLAKAFQSHLPKIKAKLVGRRDQALEELRMLPDKPENEELEIQRSLYNFSTLFQHRVKSKDFTADWAGQIATNFQHSILRLKPIYNVKWDRDVIDLESDVSAEPMTPTPQRKRGADHHLQGSAAVKRRALNGVDTPSIKVEDSPRRVVPSFIRAPTPMTPLQVRASGKMEARSLQQIREIVQNKSRSGMPGVINDEVYELLCMDSIRHWKGNSVDPLVADTMKFLRDEMHSILLDAFSTLRRRTVFSEASKLMNELIQHHTNELEKQLTRTCRLEAYQLYTFDQESLKLHKRQEEQELYRRRHYFRMKALTNEDRPQPKEWEKMSEEERTQEMIRMEKESKKLGRDDYDEEIKVAAYVRGYYLTAAKRFIDMVTIHVVSGLFPDIVASVSGSTEGRISYLEEKLGLVAGQGSSPGKAERLARLMAEPPADEAKREELNRVLEKVETALQEIKKLEESDQEQATARDGDMADVDEQLFSLVAQVNGDSGFEMRSPEPVRLQASPTVGSGNV